jgi:hypothetical protein
MLPRQLALKGSMMLQVSRNDVKSQPFPHVISDQILPPALYARLRADYPSGGQFAASTGETQGQGSRTGVGTGFDIYRGDTAYDALIAQSAAWAEFDAFINSKAFVDQFIDVFGAHLDEAGCSINVGTSTYNHDYIEPRSRLTEKMTIADRVADVQHKLLGGNNRNRAVELFSRLDIQRAIGGYKKSPHCDRPNRLCSLIVYLTDAEAEGIEGGSLRIYQHREKKPVQKYERHPHENKVDIIAELKPKANLGVWFPCSNNSYHGVTPVTTAGAARDFLYINISGTVANLW